MLNPHLLDDGIIVTRHVVEALLKGRRQNDNGDSISNESVSGVRMQWGWGQIVGNDTNTVDDTVTFPQTFSAPPIVLMTPLGGKTGTSADITEAAVTSNPPIPQIGSIRTNNFGVRLMRTSGTIPSSARWAYTWLAIGPA